MSQDQLLTTADLARRWRTTEQAVYGARYRGNCPNAIRIGKRLLWRLADVEVWEQERLGDDVQRRLSTVANASCRRWPAARQDDGLGREELNRGLRREAPAASE